MDNKKTGELIQSLRKEKNITQKQLADVLNVSDKAVSKWECGLGCPDISLLNKIAEYFGIGVDVLLGGTLMAKENDSGNMKKIKFYRCAECGNIITSTSECDIVCCGRKLSPLISKKEDNEHFITIENVEDENYLTFSHPMKKDHYIAFIAYSNSDKMFFTRLYPEQSGEVRLPKLHGGKFFYCCTEHGLFEK